MPTSADSYHIYCYRFYKYFWIGWIESMKLEKPLLYFDNTPTCTMFPASWIDYVTFGFSQVSVMEKLRKRYEKLKNIH